MIAKRIEHKVLSIHLSPLRGFGVSSSEVQGLAPLAIDCRPCRGLTKFSGTVLSFGTK
jgi:hypothetical protein